VFVSIKKRNGTIVPFRPGKITSAIQRAGEATEEFGEEVAQKLMLRVVNLAHQTLPGEVPSVEQIQDIVEEVLLSSQHRKTAKAYILYRDQHSKIREIVSRADVDLIDRYLDRADWQVKENSNMGYSLQGLNNYVSSEVSKVYWLNKIYPPEIRLAHTEGDFHIHDLGILSVYCVGWDIEDLLLQGFRGAAGKVESKPAKHLRSALGQIVNFFYTLQGEAAGAQAFSHFDTFLAPFIRADSLGFDEVKQRAVLAEAHAKHNALALVALDGDRIVGNLLFEGGDRPRIRHGGEFGISVLQAYAGQGVGRAMLEALIAWAEGSGVVRKLDLRVRSDNLAAIRLYERLGWKVEGLITRDLCIDGVFHDALYMGRHVDPPAP
jgi:RimJ/RimL family protein N-acetyltransferase